MMHCVFDCYKIGLPLNVFQDRKLQKDNQWHFTICLEKTIEAIGRCNTCTNRYAQLKCDI